MSPPPRSDRLDTALAKIRQCATALTALAQAWPLARPQSLWWDSAYGILATGKRRAVYRALFGSYPDLRSVISSRSVRAQLRTIGSVVSPRRWRGPLEVAAPLPDDAVVIPPAAAKHGIVIVSAEAGMVLKLNYDRPEVRKEIENWDIIRAAGIEDHVPALIGHGHTGDGGQWMLVRFAPNTDPLDRPLNPFVDQRPIWRHWLRWKILPTMERFYDASGVDVVDVDNLLTGIRTRLVEDSMPEPLLRVAELAGRARSTSGRHEALVATIHKDIVPSHVHRAGHEWWLLDWGSTGRGLTSKEVFRPYFWTSLSRTVDHPFWTWLRGDVPVPRLPAALRAEIELYLDWYAAWRKTSMDTDALRCQLLIALLTDMQEVIEAFALKDRLPRLDLTPDLPSWVRSLPVQLEALGVR